MQTQENTNNKTERQYQAKQAYQARVQAELTKLNAQIDELKAKAEQAKVDAAIEYNSELQKVITKRDAMDIKLQEFQQASEQAWSELQSGVESAWQELQGAFDSALSKFQ